MVTATLPAALGGLTAMAWEQRGAIGPCLVPAVERIGTWTALHAFEPEANSLYEHVSCRVLETTLRAFPAGFCDLMRIFSAPRPLAALLPFGARHGLSPYLDVAGMREAASPREAVDFFWRGLEKCRDDLEFAPVGSDLYLLGREFLAESVREMLVDPRTGAGIERALRSCVDGPFSLLTLDRFFHLLQGADYLFKIRELTDLPWDSLQPADRTAFVPDGHLERAMEALETTPSSPSFMDLELGRRLARGSTVFRRLSREEMTRQARERMGDAVRTDNVRALRRKSLDADRPDEILLRADDADDADGLHDFIHNLQEERKGAAWISENLLTAEMEAHAWEIHFRRRLGNFHLYDSIAALSPFGFAMGLRHYVEQVYFRLADAPGVVS